MKRLLLLLLLVTILAPQAKADEGMWLPSVISKERLKEMKRRGFKLKAKDIYSINEASLKDAVVLLKGCTGEIISNQGLILTNHHCGYGQIQYHSSLENDYLTNGFTAMNKGEELPSNDYWASILVRMDDVTEKVLEGVSDSMSESDREKAIEANKRLIIAEATNGTGYEGKIEALYYNNQYFMFIYEKFTDVRLVVAPPSAIGKFGGDTDNWMWPRHTGDFAMFRIYAGNDNKPAAYSKNNVPYTPKRSFKISTKGVKEGDFTFVYGFPGRTQEYLLSDAVDYIATKSNPHKIALRDIRLDVIKAAMEADRLTRIKYSAKTDRIANAWKKWQGESGGIIKLEAVAKKERLEEQFKNWSKGNPKYEGTVERLSALYTELEPYAFVYDYMNEAVMGIEAIAASNRLPKNLDELRAKMDLYFKDYDVNIDKTIAKALLKRYVEYIDEEYTPTELPVSNSAIDQMVEDSFSTSVFTSKERFDAAIAKGGEELTKIIVADPIFSLREKFFGVLRSKVLPKYNSLNKEIVATYKNYMQGLMDMQPEREFYPDANSTLRIAYGQVSGFTPRDGVRYRPVTTLEGVIDKDNPEIYDYNVPAKLHEVYKNKDYGRWAVNGTVPVCILASNHTTGGNSGSPILNGKGELIGLNFDRCWESTMSDIIYDIDMCRNIGVDIRYVLFITDKVCGAGYLIDEMELVN